MPAPEVVLCPLIYGPDRLFVFGQLDLQCEGEGEINIGQLEGLVQRGIVTKYELIPLTYKEVRPMLKFLDVLCHSRYKVKKYRSV
jgi:hypothetical protein